MNYDDEELYGEEKVASSQVLKRLLGYAVLYKKQLLWAFIALLLGTAADVLGPILIKIFIDDYLTPRIFPWQELVFLASGFLALHLISVTLLYYQIFSFQKIAMWIIHRLRNDVFGKVQYLGLRFFDKTPGGSLVSRITNDTEAIKDFYVSVLSVYVQGFIFIVMTFLAMFYLDVRLALVTIIFIPVIVAIMAFYRRISTKLYHQSRKKLSQLNAKLNESLQGMYMIQAFRQEKRMQQEFGGINDEHYRAMIRIIRLNALLLRPAVELAQLLTLILLLSFFGWRAMLGPFEIGVLYVFINYLNRLYEPIINMAFRLSVFQQAFVAGSRVFGLMDETEMAPQQEGDPEANPIITKGEIQFKDVTFSYDGVTPVLKNISFTAKPGETVALVGHTGSGKSSIINLLMRFYPIEQGEILIDGVPLTNYKDEELRNKIGLVLQDPFLFVGDVKFNIRLHHKEISDEEVKEAAHFVQAHHFIEQLEKGYEHPVAERGSTFSSGQRQLLSFARTMVMDPKVLVLDEATASVDTETEEAIQAALEKMRRGRTTIAIAHRLSTIQDADQILVLHQGEIVEQGTHQSLLEQQGYYYKMYVLQQGIHEETSEIKAQPKVNLG
ncbi:ABC transporter ATP-binding protein [Rubeoparvulum massiliense]|uniref:ABC transporter ATP-binding protein n=1 Tax=Rubeoparvulum massiliense TaxID=1631346 RepID=UPI00065E03D8|nr:ABC transporter ATP-binding protein [Rubeoparvulum massiliense]